MSAKTIDEKFMAKVIKQPTGCWEWTGAKIKGYGRLSARGRSIGAHRYFYMNLVGPIPDGLHLDHLCRNPSCVCPDHLEPVTPQENTRRSLEARGRTLKDGRVSHCLKGHPYNEENIYYNKRGYRECKTCSLARIARNKAARAAFAKAYRMPRPTLAPFKGDRRTGVTFHKTSGKWQSLFVHNWKQYYQGLFEKKEDAIAATRAKRIELGIIPSCPWREISTAPKDGTRVQAWSDEWQMIAIVKYSPGHPEPHWTIDSGAVVTPTHWQPLPPPPTPNPAPLPAGATMGRQ